MHASGSVALAFALRIGLALALHTGAPPLHARAQATAQTRVSVDWSAVRDADVERCGLSRLRAITIERLVGAGYAVVEHSGDSGVRVSVASAAAGVRVRVEGPGVVREDTLDFGPQCDPTFALEASSRIVERVDEVARELSARAAASQAQPANAPPAAEASAAGGTAVDASAAASDDPAHEQPERAVLQAGIDLSARINASPGYQLGGGLGLRARLPEGWELGARAELTVHASDGVTVLEAMLAPALVYQPAPTGLGAYLELGPVLHLATSDARDVRELDALLGLGPQLALGHVLAQLLVYGRLRNLVHRVNGETIFETAHLGIVLRVGAQLSGR